MKIFGILYETQRNFCRMEKKLSSIVKRSLKSRRIFFVSVYSRIRNTPLIVIPRVLPVPGKLLIHCNGGLAAVRYFYLEIRSVDTVDIAGDTPSLPFREGRLMASV